jgi:hypothetical protein
MQGIAAGFDILGRRQNGPHPRAPLSDARSVEMPDDRAADAVRRPVDHLVQVGADVADDGCGCIAQMNLDATELVGSAAWPVLVAKAHDDAMNAVAVPRQDESQPPFGMRGQRDRGWKSQTPDIDVHACPFMPQKAAAK